MDSSVQKEVRSLSSWRILALKAAVEATAAAEAGAVEAAAEAAAPSDGQRPRRSCALSSRRRRRGWARRRRVGNACIGVWGGTVREREEVSEEGGGVPPG